MPKALPAVLQVSALVAYATEHVWKAQVFLPQKNVQAQERRNAPVREKRDRIPCKQGKKGTEYPHLFLSGSSERHKDTAPILPG